MTNTEQYVGVQVNFENYAIPILKVHEIIRMQEITHVPDTRPSVLGVIKLRGQIIPIISLRERLGLPDADFTKHTRIVIVTEHEEHMGMIVDRVNQVLSFEDIQPPPHQGKVAYLSGLGCKGDMLVSILDLEHLIEEGMK